MGAWRGCCFYKSIDDGNIADLRCIWVVGSHKSVEQLRSYRKANTLVGNLREESLKSTASFVAHAYCHVFGIG